MNPGCLMAGNNELSIFAKSFKIPKNTKYQLISRNNIKLYYEDLSIGYDNRAVIDSSCVW